MQICPQCARSYADTETFCADDGAKLGSGGTAAGRVTTLMADDAAPAKTSASGGGMPGLRRQGPAGRIDL